MLAKILIRLVLPHPVSPINITGISQFILSKINIILIKLSGVRAYSDKILLTKSSDIIRPLIKSNNSSINCTEFNSLGYFKFKYSSSNLPLGLIFSNCCKFFKKVSSSEFLAHVGIIFIFSPFLSIEIILGWSCS